jgi:hypothetical protein
MGASRPVVLIPPGWIEPSEPGGVVLVGIDGGPHDPSAVSFAFKEASWRHAMIEVVHLWAGANPDVLMWGISSAGWGSLGEGVRTALESLAWWQRSEPGVLVVQSIESSRRGRGIARRAAYANLLVVGGAPSGRRALTSLRAADPAVRHATCPVAVVHDHLEPE